MEKYVCDSKDDKEIELKECYAEKDQQQEQGNINCAQILQIAQMIQQKAETLQTERQHLEFLQFKVQDLKKEYALQLEMNDKVKYNLFKQLRTVYGLEMRSIKRKEENVGKRRRIEQCIHTIQRLKEEKDAFRKKNKIHQELYFPHLANINICQRTLERKIHTIQDEQESRDNELNFLTSERYRNLSQVNELQHEGKDIQSELEIMKKAELDDDEEITSLTAQVRATLAKRASLRHSLVQAKERNENAHESMVKWEREYMEKQEAR